jgi:3-deoxy-7-phosphoheptulonate synthase
VIIALKQGIGRADAELFAQKLEKQGVRVDISEGAGHIVLGLVGDTSAINDEVIRANRLVEKVIRIQEPYKYAGRKLHPADTVIELPGTGAQKTAIGGASFTVIAGPCSVESREQITGIAASVKKAGAAFLRGGVFKSRTSPYSFQGIGSEGLALMLEAKKETGLPIVTEALEISQIALFEEVDVIQVGARNMQNVALLKELGRCGKPVLLKRGHASTMTELLMAAEHIMAGGNDRIILCERGIRSFDGHARNTLDLAIVPALKQKSHLPVIVDPSHGTGLSWMVPAMSKAALAAGADGIIVEVHNNPENALCDGEQSITPEEFSVLMDSLRKYVALEGKSL